MSRTRKTTFACLVFELPALDLVPYSKPCVGHNSLTVWNIFMKLYRCMHDIEAMCNEHGRQLLLIWFINYLPLTKFHIVNPVWAISTLLITSCCTCHNYRCNLFLNGILAGASVSCGHFSSSSWFSYQKVHFLTHIST